MDSKENIRLLAVLGTSIVIILLLVFIILFILINKKSIKKQQNLLFQKLQLESKSLRDLISATENEKNRIARDIHDEIGPKLSILKLKHAEIESSINENQQKSYLEQKEIISSVIQDIRSACHDLSSSFVLKFGLLNSLQGFIFELTEKYSIPIVYNVHFDIKDIGEFKIINIYRILTELINNAIKYSGSFNFSIDFESEEENLLIYFTYDGKGINNHEYIKLISESKSLGLKNIHDRLTFINGKIDFQHNKNKSLTKITIPINETNN